MNKEEFKKIIKELFSSSFFKVFVIFLVFVLVTSISFNAGVNFGFRKANFSKSWGDNYSKNFGMPMGGKPMMGNNLRRIPNPNGAIGRIIKKDSGYIIVMDDKDNLEKVILIDENTEIRFSREKVSFDSINEDDFVVIIGSPNLEGQISAKLIRVMPAPFEIR